MLPPGAVTRILGEDIIRFDVLESLFDQVEFCIHRSDQSLHCIICISYALCSADKLCIGELNPKPRHRSVRGESAKSS